MLTAFGVARASPRSDLTTANDPATSPVRPSPGRGSEARATWDIVGFAFLILALRRLVKSAAAPTSELEAALRGGGRAALRLRPYLGTPPHTFIPYTRV